MAIDGRNLSRRAPVGLENTRATQTGRLATKVAHEQPTFVGVFSGTF